VTGSGKRGATSSGEPSGVLVVDKPVGPTSFDVVARVRRALGARKAGHAGTLDPAATGVLAVCLGEAVRLQAWLADGDKAYAATVAFGAATDTEDAEGRVVAEGDPSGLTAAAVEAALARFVGEIDQVPPMYSAVRVAGRRLHQAARAGEEVARAPRRVRVDALTLEELDPAVGGRRLARVVIRCGKGTYVRTLAADLGRVVGVPAHLAALRRTAASGFTLAQAVPLAEIERLAAEGAASLGGRILSLADALAFMPRVTLTATQVADLRHGRALPLTALPGLPAEASAGPLRALDGADALVAICTAGGGMLRPVRVFAAPTTPARAAGGERLSH
jgi:tRNA pseudouridine55 synthase